MSLATKNVATVFVGVGMILALSFAVVTPAKADMLSDLQAQVQALLAQIAALQGGSTTPSTGGSCTTFTRNHQLGDNGGEVMQIQKFLNSNGAVVSATGAGSVGNESSYFGAKTKAAVAKFQAANGVAPAAGYWGPLTRAKANSMCTTTGGGTTGGGTTTPTGSGLTVMAGTQPANSLAPQSAARVPFTTFTLTNNSGAAVTVNGITVKRTGLGANAVFSGIVLIDSNGLQVGTSKTLNSNDQAILGDSWTINPGQSQTFTVAGNMAANLSSYAGQVVSLSVVGVNTTATVTGSLPITGAMQTVNATLSMGSISTSSSAFDPGSNQTKSIGDTNVRFTGIRFTAGSSEDVRLFSVRWRQVGSASSVDLANVMTYVNGTAYPAVLDASGKYYTTTIPGGVLIAKGNSVDVYVQGDIVGSNASSRTIEFNIDRVTDVYFVGQTFGYGIAPSGTNTPWLDASTVTVQGGSATTISKANEVAAQNIAVNLSNQPLGGFVTDFKGEAVSVTAMTFTYATSAPVGLLTNVSIVDENGVVVAGPVDATYVSGTATLTFGDTVTFPIGRKVYTVKGKVPSGASSDATITLSTTPSGWTSPTGQTSGNSVSITQGAFTMNAMTVKTATLAIAVSTSPAAQNIVAGGVATHFATLQFDATQSGEDVRFSTVAVTATTTANVSATNILTSCQLFDGATAVNTGSNVVNPTLSNAAATAHTFTMDNPVVITKGTVKELMVKCNVAGGATGALAIGMTSAQKAAVAATGAVSGNGVTPTGATNVGQAMTIASGSFVVSTDASSPSYSIVSGGSTGVTLGVAKLRASNESVNLQRIGLKLTNAASSSASDLVSVTLWNGTTQIGSATFVGANTHATSTLTSPLLVTKDTDMMITIKGNMADVGGSNSGTTGALIAVDVDSNTNTYGTGVGSGSTINSTGSTAVSGVRLFKSFPVIAEETGSAAISSTGLADNKLMRFKVTADSKGSISIAKFSLTFATTSATLTNVNVYGYTDASYSTPVSGVQTDGGFMATAINPNAFPASTEHSFWAQTSAAASTTVQVPAGTTRYFEVRGSVAGVTTGSSVVTTLLGDAGFPALAGFDGTATTIHNDSNNDFIWSPNTDGASLVTDADWTNGFGVVGLPSGGLTKTRSN